MTTGDERCRIHMRYLLDRFSAIRMGCGHFSLNMHQRIACISERGEAENVTPLQKRDTDELSRNRNYMRGLYRCYPPWHEVHIENQLEAGAACLNCWRFFRCEIQITDKLSCVFTSDSTCHISIFKLADFQER